MRHIIWTALFAFTTLFGSAFVAAQSKPCPICGYEIDPDNKFWWGGKAFCSQECRDEHNAERFRCKICNELTEPGSSPAVTTDGMFTYIRMGPGPKWDGYCPDCREGVKAGVIDPQKDKYRAPRSAPAAAPAGETQPTDDEKKEEDKGWFFGFGLTETLIGLGIGLVFWFGNKLRG